jgi:hypothetical protein
MSPKAAVIERTRRTPEQLIADLEKKIASIKHRAEQKRVSKDPALRHVKAAAKSLSKAIAASTDAATRKALSAAQSTVSACLALNGVMVPTGAPVAAGSRRSSQDVESFGATLLDYVKKNPGQRGEHIAAALGTDTKAMRLPMKKLIEDGAVKTKGERRGMMYFAA